MPTLLVRLWKKALPQKAQGSGLRAQGNSPQPPAQSPQPSESPYTDEEARKVKERLQGLGYID